MFPYWWDAWRITCVQHNLGLAVLNVVPAVMAIRCSGPGRPRNILHAGCKQLSDHWYLSSPHHISLFNSESIWVSPAGRIPWAEVPPISRHVLSQIKAWHDLRILFFNLNHIEKTVPQYHYHIHLHSEASSCSTTSSTMTFHLDFAPRPVEGGHRGLDLFGGDLFGLYAWAAESQQVSWRAMGRSPQRFAGKSMDKWMVNSDRNIAIENWPCMLTYQRVADLTVDGFFGGWDGMGLIWVLQSEGAGPWGPFCVTTCGYSWDGWLKNQHTPTLKMDKVFVFPVDIAVFWIYVVLFSDKNTCLKANMEQLIQSKFSHLRFPSLKLCGGVATWTPQKDTHARDDTYIHMLYVWVPLRRRMTPNWYTHT